MTKTVANYCNLDGSLNADANKGITLIEYNYLKLPKRVVQNGVTTLYQYTATGTKLREMIGTNFTDYSGNTIYKNGQLYQIAHDEGRIINGEYEYFINDHLGNLRVSFRDSSGIAKVSQKQDYDPFGNELRGLSFESNPATKNNFKFLGRESLPEIGLVDLQKRWYDPVIGRFISIDPLAEEYNYNSTFAFAENKLGLGVEYEGLELAPFEQMHSRQVIEQNKKGMTETQAQNYEVHGNKVATVFVGGALSAGIIGGALPADAIIGAATGSGISGSLTAVDGGSKTQIMNSMVTGGIAGAITGGGSAIAKLPKLGGSESIKTAINATSGYIAGATESAMSQTLNKGKVNSGDVVRAATVSSAFTVIGGKLGNFVENVVNKVITNTALQQVGKETSNFFKDIFLNKTSNDINDKIKTEKK